MTITWDEAKNLLNKRDHGISFEEASALFAVDPDARVTFLDDDHSDDEFRWKTIGPIRRGIVLVVYAEWQQDTIRIISARHATKGENAAYHAEMKGRQP